MVNSFSKISPTFLGGVLVASFLVAVTVGTLIAVVCRIEGFSGLTWNEWTAIRFTFFQSFVSAAVSVLLAIPVSRAFFRQDFIGRNILITLLGAPFILPVIVAILGLILVFGSKGILSQLMGFSAFSIYGVHGVILAHVFFNLPLATRLLLQGWGSIPSEQFRLGQSLSFSPFNFFMHLELPMLCRVIPGVFLIIFLICTTSFAVALTLGGGPKATTVELAIYQAFRFDFNLSRVAILSIIQLLMCGLIAVLSIWIAFPAHYEGGLDRVRPIATTGKILDFICITCATIFLILPLAMILIRGSGGLFLLPQSVMFSALRSILVALAATGLATIMTLYLASLVVYSSKVYEIFGYLPIAASPLVLGTGLYIIFYNWIDPGKIALPSAIVINAMMCIPFSLRIITPAFRDLENSFGRLANSLNLVGWSRFRWLIWPRLKGPIGFSAGLSVALSMGDLGVIVLFSNPNHSTLPMEIYRLMTAYRMDEAFGAALLLLMLSISLFWTFDKGGRINAIT